jgi:hypothetical protein
MKYKKQICIICALGLMACAGIAPVVKYDPIIEAKARSFEVKPGLAKVYFTGGDKKGSLFGDRPHGLRSNLFVNGLQIASVNSPDTVVFDLRPGTYSFSWGATNAQTITIPIAAGEIVAIRGDYNMGGGAYFGAIGALAGGPFTSIVRIDKSQLNMTQIVAPQTCPPNICIP